MQTCFICEHQVEMTSKTGTFEGRLVHDDCANAMKAWVEMYIAEESNRDDSDLLKKGEKIEIHDGEELSRNSFGLYIHHYKSKMVPGALGMRIVTNAVARALYKGEK